MKYTEQVLTGQYFTPHNLTAKMIAAVPNDLLGKPVLEPTCGNGNLVIALLDKMVYEGIDPDTAVSLIRANELDVEVARECEERVKQWMTEHGCKTESFTVTTYDAAKHKFENYDWVFANPPYGSFMNHIPIMKQILKNTCTGKPSVLLVKNTVKLDNVIHLEYVDFPGISVSTVIATTYPGQGKKWNLLDQFTDILDECCKWECNKDEANYVAIARTSHKSLLRIMRKGESRAKDVLYLKLTEQEASYLLQNSANTEREQAYMEVKGVHAKRAMQILRHAVNESEKSKKEPKELLKATLKSRNRLKLSNYTDEVKDRQIEALLINNTRR